MVIFLCQCQQRASAHYGQIRHGIVQLLSLASLPLLSQMSAQSEVLKGDLYLSLKKKKKLKQSACLTVSFLYFPQIPERVVLGWLFGTYSAFLTMQIQVFSMLCWCAASKQYA